MAIPLIEQEVFFGGNGITAGLPNVIMLPTHSSGQMLDTTVYVIWSAGTSAGQFVFETSPVFPYDGTWAPIGSAISWATDSTIAYLTVTGPFKYMRMRISTNVVGGTVRVFFCVAASAYHQ